MTEHNAIHLYCPYCHHGEIVASNHTEEVMISALCPICESYFYADLKKMQTYRRQRYNRNTDKKLLFLYRVHCPCPGCKGEIRATSYTQATISVLCGKRNCHQYYIADLETMTATPSTAIKKPGRTKKK